jgi:hypothetical protein
MPALMTLRRTSLEQSIDDQRTLQCMPAPDAATVDTYLATANSWRLFGGRSSFHQTIWQSHAREGYPKG